MKRIYTKAYAKINLTLDVYPKKDSELHELKSLMQTISIHDDITIDLNESERFEIFSDASSYGIRDDICVKAVQLFFKSFKERFRLPTVTVGIHLFKNIPMEAGLGGGSSDAAAILQSLYEYFNISDDFKLHSIAHQLGSDVTFFLQSGLALVEEYGNKTTPLKKQFKNRVLIVVPNKGLSTRSVYEQFDIDNREITHYTDQFLKEMSESNVFPTKKVGNSLQKSAFALYEELPEIKNKLLSYGAAKCILCGSGSAMAAFFDDDLIFTAESKLSKEYKCFISDFYYKN